MKTRTSALKLSALALLLVMLFTMFVGCQSNQPPVSSGNPSAPSSEAASSAPEEFYCNKEGYPIVNEPIEVTCARPNNMSIDSNSTKFKSQMLERFGIDIKFTDISADDWNTKLSLMINSDELPDIIGGAAIDRAQMNIWGGEGYFIDWMKYLDWTPNLVQMFKDYPSLKLTFSDDKGAIYGINQVNNSKFSNSAMVFINNAWLKNVGLETPRTTEELYTALKAFKEKDANGNGKADELPISMQKGAYKTLESVIMNAFGVWSKDVVYSIYADENGKVVLGNTSDNYKEFLKYMNKLYAEQLIDPEAYIQTKEEMRSKGADGRIGMIGGEEPASITGKGQAEDYNWDAVLGLTSEFSNVPGIVTASGVSNTVRMAISSKSEYPEALLRMIDYFYTDEGRIEARYGYEGESFEWVTDDVVGGSCPMYITPADGDANYKWHFALSYVFDVWFPTNKFDICESIDYDAITDEQFKNLTEVAYGWVAPFYKAYNRKENVIFEAYPNVCYTADEGTERTQLYNDISTTIASYHAAFITGESDIDAEWDSYVKELNTMGLEKLLTIEQAAYDRYAANK